MRDENRIDYMLKLVGKIWHKHPDMRFGQLVSNLYTYTSKTDMFYVEDDELMRLLQKATRHE